MPTTTTTPPLEPLAWSHAGLRVADRGRSVAFYRLFGFDEVAWHEGPKVAILRSAAGLELNLIVNATADSGGQNVLMDLDPVKHAGYTHMALRVASVAAAMSALAEAGVAVSEGPVRLGQNLLAVFVRDPDRNVLELDEVLEGTLEIDKT
ncbi:MAG: VOC family protein [Myxococcales bacterium]|jgi:catechol 2,3-dioxygenase-like lactoylglutathione lyase family enzyme|nr:VOC family protein [Myxococcales bacterium]MBL0195346.1 VOC family protein [Myxococcales bacterium]HQY64503.1 VOC family protein [Polyangiaceae bacterium]